MRATPTRGVTVVPPATVKIRYIALIAMMLTSFVLVTAEFLPNAVLTEMAAGLGVTPGQAGQAVTATAFVGFLVAPTIGLILPRLDRRTLLVALAVAGALSNLLVAVSPHIAFVLLSRILLGAAVSGFWAMSLTVAVRITGPERFGRAMMFTTAGSALATVLGLPLGLMLNTVTDWRTTFIAAGLVTLVIALLLKFTVPATPAQPAVGLVALGRVVVMPGVALGLLGHIFTVLGHFEAYTYIRVALGRITSADGVIADGAVALLIAAFGIGGVVGNVVVGLTVDRGFRFLATLVPGLIVVPIVALAVWPGSLAVAGVAVVVWGFAFAGWQIVLNDWVGRRLPNHLEAGGGLTVAGFQLAIMLAAAIGGLLVDAVGVQAVLASAAGFAVIGTVLFTLAARSRPGKANKEPERAS